MPALTPGTLQQNLGVIPHIPGTPCAAAFMQSRLAGTQVAPAMLGRSMGPIKPYSRAAPWARGRGGLRACPGMTCRAGPWGCKPRQPRLVPCRGVRAGAWKQRPCATGVQALGGRTAWYGRSAMHPGAVSLLTCLSCKHLRPWTSDAKACSPLCLAYAQHEAMHLPCQVKWRQALNGPSLVVYRSGHGLQGPARSSVGWDSPAADDLLPADSTFIPIDAGAPIPADLVCMCSNDEKGRDAI